MADPRHLRPAEQGRALPRREGRARPRQDRQGLRVKGVAVGHQLPIAAMAVLHGTLNPQPVTRHGLGRVHRFSQRLWRHG